MTKYDELGYSDHVTYTWKRGPQKKTARMLDRALELVNSVPYEVTTRWLFYGIWQEGFYPRAGKGAKDRAYSTFCTRLSTLRHSAPEFQERWPIELADDRRDPVDRTGYASATDWLRAAARRVACNVDAMAYSENYVMVGFEAEAMLAQFRHITEPYGVTLWPFSGQASIAYKKRMARAIEEASCDFNKPVVMLYFGDLDPMGESIPESVFRHVRKWCEVDFSAYRCGLTEAQVQRYGVESDDGKYQWEAVRHEPAVEIITGALNDFCRLDDIKVADQEQDRMTRRARAALLALEQEGE